MRTGIAKRRFGKRAERNERLMQKESVIFIIEDDENIRVLLEVALKASGFITRCFDGAEIALLEAVQKCPDAMILDIMMKGMDGISALRMIRQNDTLKHLPVMLLTAKDTESDKVLGLDAGADDYMTKPFSVLELCARVRALVRRGASEGITLVQREQSLLAEGLILNCDLREVTLDQKPIELTLKEFELLKMLMENCQRVVDREQLLQQVWGYEFAGETRTLDMHIGTLRHKLGDDQPERKYIKTIRGVGYRFLLPVEKRTT